MELSQLVYVSRREPWVTLEALHKIVAHSAMNNRARDITGILLINGQNLMQLLEGNASDIQSLFDTIRKDTRHTNVSQLLLKTVNSRLFPEWGMEMADLNHRRLVDAKRLNRMMEDVRVQVNTGRHNVEARMLLNDFRQQLATAA